MLLSLGCALYIRVLEIVFFVCPNLVDSLELMYVSFPNGVALVRVPFSRLSVMPFVEDMRERTCLNAGKSPRIAPERMMKMPAM